ncbi:MAG: glycosyltransferase family 4 protein [Patescibacteria group bacterium]
MKILIAHKYWFPRDGSTTHVFDLVEMLVSHGHTVIPFGMRMNSDEAQMCEHIPLIKQLTDRYTHFFVSRCDFNSAKGIIQKIHLFCRMLYSLEAKRKFRALAIQERPDIVHIHNIYHHISPSILDVCRELNIPVVQTVHDYKLVCPNYKLFARAAIDEGCLKGNYFHDAWNRSVKGSILAGMACAIEMTIHRALGMNTKMIQKWIAPSSIVAEKLIQGGYSETKIYTLNHFVKSADDSSDHIQKKDFLLCVGRLSEEKGFDVALAALKYLSLPLVIVGDGSARESLERHAATSGVSDRVHFAGFQPREEVRRLMASARFVLVPSRWHEPFCYVVPESLFAHTLPIGSDIGALRELLGAVSEKLLVPGGDPIALAGRITELLGNTALMEDLINKGIQHYENICLPQVYYDSLMNVYREAVQELKTDKIL